MGFIDTWKAVIQTPSNFFENMPTTGGYVEPLKFVLICNIPTAIFSGFIYGSAFSQILGPSSFIIFPPLMLVAAIIGIFVMSLFVHIGVLIFAGEKKSGIEATFRALSYAQAVVVATWIPLLGLIPALYGIYLGVVGIMKVHQTTGFRAVLAYLGLIFFLAGIIVAAVVIFAIYSSMVSSAGQELPTARTYI
jgi:hypothetical protein